MEKIGILGGTFDPFHLGHLSVLEAVVEEAECDRIMLLPAKMSPFKLEQKIADEKHRIAMVSCVAAEYENVEVSTLEIDGPEVSYTYETMKKIQEKRPEDELHFIMGSDSLLTLESWYMGEELLRDFSFILAPRPGYDSTKTKEKKNAVKKKYGTEIRVLHNKLRDISSTEIKETIKAGKEIGHLVPTKVAEYIHEHGLYL